MRRLLAAIVSLIVVAIAIAAFAPASLVDARIHAISRGALRLADARGTLWRGEGLLTSADGLWRVPIAWTLDPLALVSGVTSIRLRFPGVAADNPSGRVELRNDRLVVESLVARVPATAVASIANPATVRAGGDIDLRIGALTLAPTGSSGGAAAQWRNARLAGVGRPVLDLGTLTATLAVQGDRLAGPISNQGGAVRVTGDVSISADRVAADVRLAPEASAPQSVQEALATLGAPDASGAVALRLDRRMR